jgi:hypothetical protein
VARHQLAVATTGDVYVVETTANAVVLRRYDAFGNRIGFGTDGRDAVLAQGPAPSAEVLAGARPAVDASGNAWIAFGDRLLRVDLQGTVSVVRAATPGRNDFVPADAQFDAQGRLHYLDLANRHVVRLEADGSRTAIGQPVPENGSAPPTRLAVSPAGALWALVPGQGGLVAQQADGSWLLVTPLIVRDLMFQARAPVADAQGGVFFLTGARLIRRVPDGSRFVIFADNLGAPDALAIGPGGVFYIQVGGAVLTVRVS